MKFKSLFLILLLPFFLYSQDDKNILLSTSGYPYYIIEIHNNVAQAITFSFLPRLGGHDEDDLVVFLDTLTKQKPANSFLFIGKKIKIKNIKGKPSVVLNKKRSKPIRLDTISDKEAFLTINHAIWNKKYYEMEQELKLMFPLLYLDYKIGRKRWKAIKPKDIYYKDFFAKAEKEITILRDSITIANQPYTDVTNHLLNNLSALSYEDLKANTLKLPMERYNQYLNAVINATCENQPEYFYRLVDDLPIDREWLFGLLQKKARKKIRKTKSKSPIKKEYLRYRRRVIACGTAIVVTFGATIYGIVWLIKR